MPLLISPPTERRKSPREGYVIEGWLAPLNSTERFEVTGFDISRDGVSFDALREIPIGNHYVFEIGFGSQRLVCEIGIANCRQVAADIWRIGSKFT